MEYSNGYGIVGKAEGKYRVFIPSNETHVDDCSFPYQIGETYPVTIKDIATDQLSLIGTFRPYIETPLQRFANKHSIGDIVNVKDLVTISDKHAVYTIQSLGNESIKATLFIGEVSNYCRINNLREILVSLHLHSFVLKEYDYTRNKAEISLKQFLSINLKQKRDALDYKTTYNGVVIGQKEGYYYLIILDLFIEGIMPVTNNYTPGTSLTISLAANNRYLPEFFV